MLFFVDSGGGGGPFQRSQAEEVRKGGVAGTQAGAHARRMKLAPFG